LVSFIYTNPLQTPVCLVLLTLRKTITMKINVLDKGFVEYIDHMGSDSRIVEAARVSYNGHSKGEEQDRKLLGYLYRNHHCYHPDMEVLTVEGWKKWRECSDEEVFAVPNSDSKTLTFEKLQVLKFPVVDEEMLSFNNSRMSFCVTNNHKMWFKGKYQDNFSLVDAGSMNKWGHFDRGSNYSVPNVGSDKFFELIGFYLGDGFLYSKNIISFRLCKSRKVEYLRNLLGSLNVPYSLDKDGVTSSGSEIFQYKFLVKDVPDIEKYIDLSKTAKYKSIDIKVLTDSQKAGLLAGMINSDGSIATGRKQTQFSSSSPDLCNVFMSISSLFGFDCHRVQSKDGCYSCIIYPNSSRISLEARKHYFSSIKYSGEVFCTTTSTNLLLVRGDSSKFSFVCGNSSPFEMCKITFKIKMPLFVAAQFNRHRMQNCLSGNTLLNFDLPSGNKFKSYKMRLDDFVDKWMNGASPIPTNQIKYDIRNISQDQLYTVHEVSELTGCSESYVRNIPNLKRVYYSKYKYRVLGSDIINWIIRDPKYVRMPMKSSLSKMKLRYFDEDEKVIKHCNIVDVFDQGEKNVYKIYLKDGKTIKCTEDHRLLSDIGWGTLKDLTDFRETDKCISFKPVRLATNGVALYKNKEWLESQKNKNLFVSEIAERAGCSYHTIRKWLNIHGLNYTPKERGLLGGRSQLGRKRAVKNKRIFTAAQIDKIKESRIGDKSHFWKGGITPARALIGRWTTKNSKHVHEKYGYKCQICGGQRNLHAHHIDPVWNNESKGFELDNLITLCQKCHSGIHGNNLEILFKQFIDDGRDIKAFFCENTERLHSPDSKRKSGGRPLSIGYSEIVKIESVGLEKVYDIEVSNKFHNFIANNIVVHNCNYVSFRYTEPEEDFYIPTTWRKQSTNNKQVSDVVENWQPSFLGIKEACVGLEYENYVGHEQCSKGLVEYCSEALSIYKSMVESGIGREMARMILPQNLYTTCYSCWDLNNLIKFLKLRDHPHAQWEIQEYARAMKEVAKQHFPWTMELVQ
jgi:flavin-dependent thymidylate synthase